MTREEIRLCSTLTRVIGAWQKQTPTDVVWLHAPSKFVTALKLLVDAPGVKFWTTTVPPRDEDMIGRRVIWVMNGDIEMAKSYRKLTYSLRIV